MLVQIQFHYRDDVRELIAQDDFNLEVRDFKCLVRELNSWFEEVQRRHTRSSLCGTWAIVAENDELFLGTFEKNPD